MSPLVRHAALAPDPFRRGQSTVPPIVRKGEQKISELNPGQSPAGAGSPRSVRIVAVGTIRDEREAIRILALLLSRRSVDT